MAEVKNRINEDAEKTAEFIYQINNGNFDGLEVPKIQNLQNVINEIRNNFKPQLV